jgi:hypothetical protein
MTLRQKQDTATQKRTGGKELDTKGKAPYLKGTMILEEDKPTSENAPTLTSSWRGPMLPKR